MRRPSLALIAGILLAPQCASGEPRPELTGPSQTDMNRQAAARYAMADKALNDVYGRLIGSSSPAGRQRLRGAQRAWLRFRDLDCEARSGAHGGSFHTAAVLLCLEELTDVRTRTLRAELECEEGDMGCGGHRED